MLTSNEQLQIFASHHSLFLERFKGHVVKKILGLLNNLDSDLVRQLSQNLSEAGTNRRRLETLLAQLRAINNTIATRIQTELENELRPFVAQEIEVQAESIHEAIKLDLAIYAPSPQQLYVAAIAEPFSGRMLSEWIESFSEARQARIRDQIRIGFAGGEGIDQIVRRIRGSRANQFRDGVLEISRRDARTITRSAISHLAAEVRERTYEANQHIIDDKVQWNATLDGRVTVAICAPRDGKIYRISDHKPVGHDLSWLGGPGNAHINCRSVSIPITRSFRDMGLVLDEPPPGTRPFVAFENPRDDQGNLIRLSKPASKMSVAEYTRELKRAGVSDERVNAIKSRLIGQVPAQVDYEKFLRGKSREFVRSVLGEKKAKLFLDGGLHLRDIVTKGGDELTLSDLRKKERKAWKEAGLDD